MKLLQTLVLLLPSMLCVISAAYLCSEGKSWGWFLLAALVMFLFGMAVASVEKRTITQEDLE
jgi:hypothetical protein